MPRYARRRYRRMSRRNPNKGSAQASKKYVKKVVARAVRGDVHHIDVQVTDSAVPSVLSSTYVHQMLPTAVGDTQQSRTGKCIQLTGIELSGSCYRNSASTSHDRIRMLIVKAKNDVGFTAANIYSTLFDTDLSTVANGLDAFRRLDGGNMPNYQILYDKQFDIGYGATDKSTKIFKWRKTFKRPLKCWYSSDALSSPITNNIYLIAVSDLIANNPFMSTSTRCKFIT